MPNAAVAAFDAHVGGLPVPGAGRRTAPLDDRQRYMAYAYRAAVRNGLDPEIFLRQLQQEAGFQPFNPDGSVKVSPAGARGLAQIVPTAHPQAQTDDPFKAIDYAAAWMGSLKKRYGGDDVKALAAYNCFDRETQVLTHRGWVEFPDLLDIDLVASFNRASGQIEFQQPIARWDYDFDGEMIAFSSSAVDLLVTPNHRMLVMSSIGNPEQFRAAGDLLGKKAYVRVAADGTSSEYPLSDDEIRIAAWVITDGTISKSPRARRAVIYQRRSKAHLVLEILDRLGWAHSQRNVSPSTTKVLNKRLLGTPEEMLHIELLAASRARLFEYLPHKRSLPGWVQFLSNRQFDLFLSAYIDGDGSRHEGSDGSFQISGSAVLLGELQAAALAHGWRANLSLKAWRQWARLNVARDGGHPSVRTITPVKYLGKVYCVTTVNDTVVVRRHGRPAITGNSGPGNVDKYGGVPPFAETQAYVRNIAGNQGGAHLEQSDVQQAAQPAGGDDGPFVSAFRSANGRDPSPAEVQMMRQQASGTSPRGEIRQRAASYVGTPYEWGGTTKQGIDCSAFISNAWGIGRQTTDTLPNVAAPVAPGDLEPGDALNLPTWKDPRGYGHVRMFDGWADPGHTSMFVYESSSATNGVVRRVVPYDPAYQPMRLKGLAAEEPEQRALKLAQMTEQAGVTTPSRPGNDGGKPAPVMGATAPTDQPRDDWRLDQPTGVDAANRDDWRLNQPTATTDQARDDWRLPTPAAATGPATTTDETPQRTPPRRSAPYVQPTPAFPTPYMNEPDLPLPGFRAPSVFDDRIDPAKFEPE